MSGAEEEDWSPNLDPEVLRRRRGRLAMAAGALVVLALGVLVAYALWEPEPVRGSYILLAAQQAVRNSLTVEGRLRFNSPAEAQIQETAEDTFLVRGWVQDVTPSGRVRAYLYSAVVEPDPRRGTATARDVQMFAQE